MANEWITWVLKQAPVDDPTETFVLMVLADSSNTDGVTWPNKKTLAAYTRLTPRSIARVIASLEEKTIVKRTARFSNGEQTSNYYQLYQRTREEVNEAIKAAKEKRDLEDGVTPMTSPHDAHDIPPMTSMTSLGVTPASHQEPLVESSVKPKKNQLPAPANANAGNPDDLLLDAAEYTPLRETVKQQTARTKKAETRLSKTPATTPPSVAPVPPKVTPAGALADALGLSITGPKDGKRFGAIARDLNEGTITCEEFNGYVVYWRIRAEKERWTFTPHSLTGGVRISEYVAFRAANSNYQSWLTHVVPRMMGKTSPATPEPAHEITPEASERQRIAYETYMSQFGGSK